MSVPGGVHTAASAAAVQHLHATRYAQFSPIASAVLRASVARLRYPHNYWEQSEDEAEWFERKQVRWVPVLLPAIAIALYYYKYLNPSRTVQCGMHTYAPLLPPSICMTEYFTNSHIIIIIIIYPIIYLKF